MPAPGSDPLGLGGQLVLDPVQLGPGPLVRLDRVEVGAEHEPAGDLVPLRSDTVGVGRPGRVDPAQPVGHVRVRAVRVEGAGGEGRPERAVAVGGDDRGVGGARRTGRPGGGLDGLAAGGGQAAVEAEGERVPPGREHGRDRGEPGGDRGPVVGAGLGHQVDAVPDGAEQPERRAQGPQRFADLDRGELGPQSAAQEPAAASSRPACEPPAAVPLRIRRPDPGAPDPARSGRGPDRADAAPPGARSGARVGETASSSARVARARSARARMPSGP